MSVIQDVQGVLDEARALIGSLSADDLSTATPCEGWDVKALVEHMTGVVQGFATALGAKQADGGADTDIKAAYGKAVDALSAQMNTPGALDKTMKLPFGEMPAERGLNIALADQMIHTWDAAKALGRPYTMDPRLAEGTLRGMRQLLTPDRRGPGQAFGHEVPCASDAPIQDQLLAFAGRQP
jgi:uncharacterized protein (TIGR03086 family)